MLLFDCQHFSFHGPMFQPEMSVWTLSGWNGFVQNETNEGLKHKCFLMKCISLSLNYKCDARSTHLAGRLFQRRRLWHEIIVLCFQLLSTVVTPWLHTLTPNTFVHFTFGALGLWQMTWMWLRKGPAFNCTVVMVSTLSWCIYCLIY